MRVKEVKLQRIEKLLDAADSDLYITSISFEGDNYVLNLQMPFDDSEKRAENFKKVCDDYQNWVAEMDEYFKKHPEL